MVRREGVQSPTKHGGVHSSSSTELNHDLERERQRKNELTLIVENIIIIIIIYPYFNIILKQKHDTIIKETLLESRVYSEHMNTS